jgi:hypothetical protein
MKGRPENSKAEPVMRDSKNASHSTHSKPHAKYQTAFQSLQHTASLAAKAFFPRRQRGHNTLESRGAVKLQVACLRPDDIDLDGP